MEGLTEELHGEMCIGFNQVESPTVSFGFTDSYFGSLLSFKGEGHIARRRVSAGAELCTATRQSPGPRVTSTHISSLPLQQRLAPMFSLSRCLCRGAGFRTHGLDPGSPSRGSHPPLVRDGGFEIPTTCPSVILETHVLLLKYHCYLLGIL